MLESCLPNDSWLREYMQIWPTAEPPKSYILFAGMAMLGAALGRRVWVDLDIHTTYPLMNLLLIGPSGIGKSTALVDMAMDHLIRPLPEGLQPPHIITGKSTKEALHEDLMQKPHSIIMASELANFFSKEKYQEGMIPYMTDLLDLRPASIRTKGGGPAKIVYDPAVCVCGGSTKEWLQEQLPSSAGVGGFLPRFVIVKEDHKGQRVPDPNRVLSKAQRDTLAIERERVFYEFTRILRMSEGPVDFADYAASDAYGLWYQSFTPDTGNLAPFAARAGAHVLRMALLVALSCRRAELTAEDIQAGIALYDYTQRRLQEVIVPMSPQGKMLNKVMEAIGDDYVSDVQIKRAMRNYCSSQDVDKMLQSLLGSRDILFVDGKFRRVHGRT